MSAATSLPRMASKTDIPPAGGQPSCKQGPLCLSSDPFCLLKAETGPVAFLLASQPAFRLRASAACLVLPSSLQPTSSLQHPTAFIWIYRAVMARVQTRAGRISGGPASSYSATHNLLVILLGSSDSDVTLLRPGSWWDWARRTKRIMPAPTEARSTEQKVCLQPSFKSWHN